MIAGATLDHDGDGFGQFSVPFVFRSAIEKGKAFGLLRPADIAGSEVLCAESVSDLFREHERRYAQEEIADAPARVEDWLGRTVTVVLQQPDQKTTVAP